MRKLAITAVVAALAATLAPASADEPLVGIVSDSATEANNARYIPTALRTPPSRSAGMSQ